MSAPRQRQAYDHGTRGDIRTMNDEPGSPIEHRAARRNRQVGRLGARRLMVLITAVGSICLLYLWLGAEAARFSWEKEDMWKPLWYPHLATWYALRKLLFLLIKSKLPRLRSFATSTLHARFTENSEFS